MGDICVWVGQGSATVVKIGQVLQPSKGPVDPLRDLLILQLRRSSGSRVVDSTLLRFLNRAISLLDRAPGVVRSSRVIRASALSVNICPIFDVRRGHARGPIRPVNTLPAA